MDNSLTNSEISYPLIVFPLYVTAIKEKVVLLILVAGIDLFFIVVYAINVVDRTVFRIHTYFNFNSFDIYGQKISSKMIGKM